MTELKAPVAEKINKALKIHNDTRIDAYYWLRDRENPKVIDYINAENKYCDEKLKHTEAFQHKLFEELKGRIKEDDASVPYLSNGFYYYQRFEQGEEYPIYCRKKNLEQSDEEILLDVNDLAKEYSFYQIGGRAISANNKWLAFGEDIVSRRLYTLRFKNLITGEVLEERIPNTSGSVAWASDNRTVF